MRTTIVEAFHRHEGIELKEGERRPFNCDAVVGISELAGSGLLAAKSYDLVVVDLRLPEGAYAGTMAMLDARYGRPEMKIVVFTGLPGGGGAVQDWLNACVRMMRMGAWDFFRKGSPTELVDRLVQKWQTEEKAKRLEEEAMTKSVAIRREKMWEWSGKFVAFYIDPAGALRPNPALFRTDKYLSAPTYLELLLTYEQLRQHNPAELPERPFVAFMSTIKGGIPA